MASSNRNIALSLRRARAQTADDLAATLQGFAEPLPELRLRENFGASFDRFADATVVLLGEATHGTSEFYNARAAITRRLIQEHGFRIVAVEAAGHSAEMPDTYPFGM